MTIADWDMQSRLRKDAELMLQIDIEGFEPLDADNDNTAKAHFALPRRSYAGALN